MRDVFLLAFGAALGATYTWMYLSVRNALQCARRWRERDARWDAEHGSSEHPSP